MNQNKVLAAGAAIAALLAAPAVGAASSAGTTVTVRIEGLHKTLLAPTSVTTYSGWITKGGTPSGKCSEATTAAGALDVATHHKWNGTYTSSIGDIEVTSILGEKHTFTSPNYWEIFVNDVPPSLGACETKIHNHEQLLFAAVPDTPTEYPTALTAPTHATTGVAFKVKVVWFNAGGTRKPLAGAHVDSVTTNSHGIATITPTHAGTLLLRATDKGYIRSAPVPVSVS